MRIPSDPLQREFFYIDIMQKCMVSLENRKMGYD